MMGEREGGRACKIWDEYCSNRNGNLHRKLGERCGEGDGRPRIKRTESEGSYGLTTGSGPVKFVEEYPQVGASREKRGQQGK